MFEITTEIKNIKKAIGFKYTIIYLNTLYFFNFCLFVLYTIKIKIKTAKIKAILLLKYSSQIIPIKYPNSTY